MLKRSFVGSHDEPAGADLCVIACRALPSKHFRSQEFQHFFLHNTAKPSTTILASTIFGWLVQRDWCEADAVDGNGSVVETLAQDGTPLDREVPHEYADRCCAGQDMWPEGLLGVLREGLEMSRTSVVEMDSSTGKK